MINSDGYVKLRRGIYEHIIHGDMTFDMYSVYSWLLLEADHTCGIVWNTSSVYIAMKIKKETRWVQRQLDKLSKKEYIKRFDHIGKIRSYPILINKFEVFNGVIIDACNTVNLKEIAWHPVFKGILTGTYVELKGNLSGTLVSPRQELKNITITKELKKNTVRSPKNDNTSVSGSMPKGETLLETFEKFWSAYPRKVGKGAAQKSWKRITPNIDEVLKALEWQKKSLDWTKDGGKFIPHPTTYLNQGRWEDEPIHVRKIPRMPL